MRKFNITSLLNLSILNNSQFLILSFIVIIGGFLRLYRISEYMTFLGDEGRDVLIVKRMIVDHDITFLGPTASVGGFFLGPIYYYFMTPFLWLWNLDPTGPAVMVALFGIATIYLVYRLGSELMNSSMALVAAGLYAISPLIIAYSRSSWNPNIVPFFSTLLIYMLWWTVTRKKLIGALMCGIVMGIGVQLHYLFIFLLPILGIWFVLYGERKKKIIIFLFILLGFIIGDFPFLAFELYHKFPNTISIMRFISEGKDTGFSWEHFVNNITNIPLRLFGRVVFRLPPDEQWHLYSESIKKIWIGSTWVLLALSIVTPVVVLLRNKLTYENKLVSKKAVVLLLLWFFTVIILFGLYKRAIYDYYLGIAYVAPFLLLTLFMRILIQNKIGKLMVLFGIIGLIWLNIEGRPTKYPPNNQLAQAKRIAQSALEKTGGKPYNFALIANFNSDHAYRYFLEIWGRPPVTIESTEVDPGRTTVTDQLIIICDSPECKPLGNSLWEVAGFGRAEIEGEWDESFVKIFKLTHYQGV